MAETKALETNVRSFLLGVSVGTLLAMVVKPQNVPGPSKTARDILYGKLGPMACSIKSERVTA